LNLPGDAGNRQTLKILDEILFHRSCMLKCQHYISVYLFTWISLFFRCGTDTSTVPWIDLMMSHITTIIFDVDDTLYDVGTGFTASRNGIGVQTFMVAKLGFSSLEEAKLLRDEYFEKYHSTAKALRVAEQEGRLPVMEGAPRPHFCAADLAEWWATNLDFALLGGPNLKLKADLEECPLRLVAFSNGPRKYVKRVLMEIGLWEVFGETGLFAVDDVAPHCKPEKEAFQKMFDRIGVKPEECIMVEDSMKNCRMAKSLGMKTVLITGGSQTSAATKASEATKHGDTPNKLDAAVDISMDTIKTFRERLPGLWESIASFP
jgi:putative hydrolase of the HAD superfamily